MKVLTMLLGEFDFVDLMVDDPTTPWMAKVLFAAFLVVMSIVLMNLVVGLAISDIAALRWQPSLFQIHDYVMHFDLRIFQDTVFFYNRLAQWEPGQRNQLHISGVAGMRHISGRLFR